MNTQELQIKYLAVYDNFRKTGLKNKIFLLFLSIPAIAYSYFVLDGYFKRHQMVRTMPHSAIYIIAGVVGIVLVISIMTINSILFINSRKLRSFKYYFKADLFDQIMNEIPEINGYAYNQKIHPRVFYKSQLFQSKYSDYIGDDWIKGQTNENTFELCELHVLDLFKNIFSGVFIRIKINSKNDNEPEKNGKYQANRLEFEAKYDAEVLTTKVLDEIFVAIKMRGKFFEADNKRLISSWNNNVRMLKDIVGLIKLIS